MPGAVDYSRIQIVPDPDTQEWWAATQQNKFLVRECLECGNRFFPPQPGCHKCGALDVESKLGWYETQGKGVIYSYIVVVQPILQHLIPVAPYVVATIELPDCAQPDGTVCRVPGLMLDDEADVGIGLPVEVFFEETNQPDFKAPRWKVSGTAENVWRFPG